MNHNKTSRLATNAMLAALCAVLSYVSIDIGNSMRITLESFPIALGAMLLGPLDGAAIAFVVSFAVSFVLFKDEKKG